MNNPKSDSKSKIATENPKDVHIQLNSVDENANPENQSKLNVHGLRSDEDVTNGNFMFDGECDQPQIPEEVEQVLSDKFMFNVQEPDQVISEISFGKQNEVKKTKSEDLITFSDELNEANPKEKDAAPEIGSSKIHSDGKLDSEAFTMKPAEEEFSDDIDDETSPLLKSDASETNFPEQKILDEFTLDASNKQEQPTASDAQFDSLTCPKHQEKIANKPDLPKKKASKTDSMNNYLDLENDKDFEKAYPSTGNGNAHAAGPDKTRSLGRRISLGLGSVFGCRNRKSTKNETAEDFVDYAPTFTPRDSIELALARRSGTPTDSIRGNASIAANDNIKKRWSLPRKLKSWKN